MDIKINDSVKQVPSDISQISLKQFIGWHNEYGNDLDKQLDGLLKKDYTKYLTEERGFTSVTEEDIIFNMEMDIDQHIDREALCWYTYFTGFDFEAFEKENDVQDLLLQYRILRTLLKQSEVESRQLPLEIEWNGEIWMVQDYRLTPGHGMTFNEIVTSKEVVRQLHSVGKGRWQSLIYLCALFFRKKDEPFTDDLIYEGSDRMQLMETLPLNYGLAVAFFLSSSVNTYTKILAFSDLPPGEILHQN